jgi:hypothetical protein
MDVTLAFAGFAALIGSWAVAGRRGPILRVVPRAFFERRDAA